MKPTTHTGIISHPGHSACSSGCGTGTVASFNVNVSVTTRRSVPRGISCVEFLWVDFPYGVLAGLMVLGERERTGSESSD